MVLQSRMAADNTGTDKEGGRSLWASQPNGVTKKNHILLKDREWKVRKRNQCQATCWGNKSFLSICMASMRWWTYSPSGRVYRWIVIDLFLRALLLSRWRKTFFRNEPSPSFLLQEFSVLLRLLAQRVISQAYVRRTLLPWKNLPLPLGDLSLRLENGALRL